MGSKLHDRYSQLTTERTRFLREAKLSASLTLPMIFPEDTDIRSVQPHSNTVIEKPWQSVGPRGVNNLASKLVLALFPTGTSFGTMQVSPEVRAEIEDAVAEGGGALGDTADSALSEIANKLTRFENYLLNELDQRQYRPVFHEVTKHLLVTGNCLLDFSGEQVRMHPLNSYVCKRDGEGTLLELIVVEILSRDTLPPGVLEEFEAAQPAIALPGDPDRAHEKKALEFYTRVWLEDGRYHAEQELSGTCIPVEGTWAPEDLPFLPLRFSRVDREDYGRGYVEQYRGDLNSLEVLRKAVVFASANAAKVVWMVRTGATVNVQDLDSADNGAFVQGDEGDVVALRLDKGADMQVALELIRDLTQELRSDFLLNSSFQRQAERVTAEEVRLMAEELEDSLGGLYSVLAGDWQLPVANMLIREGVESGALPDLGDAASVTVVTGLAALGRGHELNKLKSALDDLVKLGQAFPQIATRINDGEIVRRVLAGHTVDATGLIKTDQQVAQEQDAQRQAAMQESMMEAGIKGAAPEAGKAAVAGMDLSDPAALQAQLQSGAGGLPSA